MPLIKFERNGILYLRGTVSLGNQSRPVYESTRIRARDRHANATFESYRIQREKAIQDELLLGPRAVITWTEAAARRLQLRHDRRLAERPDLADQPDPEAWHVFRITEFFRSRRVGDQPISKIQQADIEAYFDDVHAGHALSTKMRALAAYKGVMNLAKREGWVDKVPLPAALPRKWDNLAQPVEKMLYTEEVMLFVALAPAHFRPFVATLFGSGRRGGELLFLSRTKNLRWERDNERLFLGMTKNGKPIFVRLPRFAVDTINDWLSSRKDKHGKWKDSHDALFLTDKGKPYSRPKRQRGGIFKRAMHGVRRRVAEALAVWYRHHRRGGKGRPGLPPDVTALIDRLAAKCADGDAMKFIRERIKLVKRVTGHWGRHNAASHLYERGADEHEVMDHLGWRDARSARRYRHRSQKHQQRMAAMLDFGAESEPSLAKKLGR